MAERQLSARTQLHPALRAHRPFGSEVAPIERLPERVLSSWQRSEQYGVSLEEITAIFERKADTSAPNHGGGPASPGD